MNESTMRIDNSGLYAARWLVLLERLGLSRTAPVDDVLGGLGSAHAAQLAALRDAGLTAYNYVALQSVVVDAIRLAFDIPPAGTTAEDVLQQLAAALALVCAAPPRPADLRAQLNAALHAELTATPGQAARESDRPAALQDPADALLASSLPDRLGRIWHLLQRQDRTVSLHYTCDGKPAQYVVYDSLDQPSDDALRAEVEHLRDEVVSWERVSSHIMREREQAEVRVEELEAEKSRLLVDGLRMSNALEEIERWTRYSYGAAEIHGIVVAALRPGDSDATSETIAEERDRERSQAHSWRQLCDELGISYATHPDYLVGEGALAENDRLRLCIRDACSEIKSAVANQPKAVRILTRVIDDMKLALQGATPKSPSLPADVCLHCRGEKLVADTKDQEPWSMWRTLPVESAAAVILGVVKPIPCPTCNGTGRKPEKAG